MLFPSQGSALHRRSYLAQHVGASILKDQNPQIIVEIDRGFLTQLLDSPSRDEVKRLAERHAAGGSMAGVLLYFIVSLAQNRPQDASVLKAIDLYISLIKREPEDRTRPHSPAFVKGRWTVYKPVSHFWAASHSVAQHYPDFDHEEVPHEVFLDFLGLSEWFRGQGESIVARAQAKKHGPVLNPSETYRLPDNLEIPLMEADLPIGSEAAAILTRYRAPKRL
jgi:hypothetical protein